MKDVVPTECTDKDLDIIVEYLIDKKLGLQSVDELTMTKYLECNL